MIARRMSETVPSPGQSGVAALFRSRRSDLEVARAAVTMATRCDAMVTALVAAPHVADAAVLEAALDPAQLTHEVLMQTRCRVRQVLEAAGGDRNCPIFELNGPLLLRSASRRAVAEGCSALVAVATPATVFQTARSRHRHHGLEIVLVSSR